MLHRIFWTAAFLLLGTIPFGCEQVSRADQEVSADKKEQPKQEKTIEKEKATDKQAEKSSGEKKTASLKDGLEKYRFRWSDEKESDFPLEIKMESQEVPKEILGPFPEDAAWRKKIMQDR
jgi:hypothetical protein